MEKEEIKTSELQMKKDQLSKKLVEVREILDSAKGQMDIIGEEENSTWYSLASKNIYDKFSNDYRKFLEFDDSFRSIVDFLTQVCSGYEDWNKQMLENIAKIEDTKIE